MKIINFIKNKLPVIFFSILFCFLFIKGMLLIYPDLNTVYPFMTPDSYDWIANGLYYIGYNVFYSLRSPGLPLIIGALEKTRTLNLLPFLNQLILFGILVLLYKIIYRKFDQYIALLAALILFFNSFLHDLSLFILADLYALFFILLGYYFYTLAEEKEGDYLWASLSWSVSFLFQNAIVFMAPAIFLHFLVFRRKIKIKKLCISLLPPLFILSPYFLYKKAIYGSFFYSGVKQLDLLNFHLNSVFFYIVNTVSALGILVFMLILAGLLLSFFNKKNLQKKEFLDYISLNVLVIIFWLIFWVTLYDWNDKRFIVYLIPFLTPFLAISLQFFIKMFNRTSVIINVFLIIALLLTIKSSAVSYDSPLTSNIIKLTNRNAIKFETTIDSKNYNLNLRGYSFAFVKEKRGIKSINLFDLNKLRRKTNYKEIENLAKVKEYINSIRPTEICVEYDEFNEFKWYIDKNKYGNYFKNKLEHYPDCVKPILKINKEGIKTSF